MLFRSGSGSLHRGLLPHLRRLPDRLHVRQIRLIPIPACLLEGPITPGYGRGFFDDRSVVESPLGCYAQITGRDLSGSAGVWPAVPTIRLGDRSVDRRTTLKIPSRPHKAIRPGGALPADLLHDQVAGRSLRSWQRRSGSCQGAWRCTWRCRRAATAGQDPDLSNRGDSGSRRCLR